MARCKAMKRKRDIIPTLPFDIIELILSFLSVPELLRMRLVCKEWKEAIGMQRFHNLCNKNGKNHMYLFMWSIKPSKQSTSIIFQDTLQFLDFNASIIFQDTLQFLDLSARRWYSIPTADLHKAHGHRAGDPIHGHGVESWYKSTNNGLICELAATKATGPSELSVAISDPIAKRRTVLPTPPPIFVPAKTLKNLASSTKIVLGLDHATGSYKVFLLNNHNFIPTQPRMYIHDSSTSKWRPLQNLPNGITGSWASSAVVLHDSVFILKRHDFTLYKLTLFQYKFMDETWTEPYHMYFSRNLDECRLLVSGDRLFLDVELGCIRSLDPWNYQYSDPGLRSDPDWREGEFFRWSAWPATCFEIYEVLVGERRRKLVAQFTKAQLQQIFGGQGGSVGWNGVPCVDSDGICNSVILGSNMGYRGFRLRRYDLATGSVDTLPVHPLVKRGNYYAGSVEDIKLSLRDLLAPAPDEQTSKGR